LTLLCTSIMRLYALVTSLSTSDINEICTLKARFSGIRHPIVLYFLTEFWGITSFKPKILILNKVWHTVYWYDKPTNANHVNVQSHIIILHQHISVTPVTTIRVSYNKNTISIQIIVQMYDKTTLCYTWSFCSSPTVIKYQMLLSLR